jgi:hypothetical protein
MVITVDTAPHTAGDVGALSMRGRHGPDDLNPWECEAVAASAALAVIFGMTGCCQGFTLALLVMGG